MDRDRVRENVTEKTARARPRYTNTNSSEAIEAQRSRWAFFNSLLQDDTHGSVLAQRFQIENGFPVMDLQLSVYAVLVCARTNRYRDSILPCGNDRR